MDIKKELTELFDGTELEDIDISGSSLESAVDLIENIEEQISEHEVIYYNNAIKYLADNDPSLVESLTLASGMGYEAKNINSELLATILQQENMRQELDELTKDIEGIFDKAEATK